MVRYSKEHKAKTRDDILRAAARMFRERGYNGIGIEGIMQELGLTRGGFYNHFNSKQDLFAEVLRWDKDFVVRMRARDENALAEQGIKVAMDYLEPKHRMKVGPNCVLTTLTPDVVRAGDEASVAFTETVQALVREFERGLDNPKKDDERALVAVALCVGGLLLARGTDGTRLANKISKACQRAVTRELQS
ncbi:MAG: TetR/AcrR family transcriptional regulator [Pseudomonadota bacterium]